jgi:predicted metal-dependent phosphoesterase TrpH
VARVAAAGIRVFSVTDHDTVAALPEAASAAARHGLAWLPGIEITAIEHGRDVHVLGYGFDPAAPSLLAFLAAQRARRLARVRAFEARLAALGLPFDAAPLLREAAAEAGRSIGRAHVARALVSAGHVRDVEEAFDRWLLPGRPGFVPRDGLPVAGVVAVIREAGGLPALAHPGLIGDDDLVGRLVGTGMAAIEAYHSDHGEEDAARYLDLAARRGLAVCGGSDYHGETASRPRRIGSPSLPVAAYDMLRRRARAEGCARDFPDVPAPRTAGSAPADPQR